MEGHWVLKEYGVQSLKLSSTFPCKPAGPTNAELKLWNGELRRNYLN